MSVRVPPASVWRPIEAILPGVYWRFVTEVQRAYGRSGARHVSITSWYRSPEQNAATPGAHPKSVHQLGLALDLAGEDQALLVAPFRARGFRVQDEGHHVHIQMFRASLGESWGLYRAVGL